MRKILLLALSAFAVAAYAQTAPQAPRQSNKIVGGETAPVSSLADAASDGIKIGSTLYYGDSENAAIRQNGGEYIENVVGVEKDGMAGDGKQNARTVGGDGGGSGQLLVSGSSLQLENHDSPKGACETNNAVTSDYSGRLFYCKDHKWVVNLVAPS